ncbi:hypothetical protein GN956_G1541 [Arapaima gigas]
MSCRYLETHPELRKKCVATSTWETDHLYSPRPACDNRNTQSLESGEQSFQTTQVTVLNTSASPIKSESDYVGAGAVFGPSRSWTSRKSSICAIL